jgi:hypothetical protein
MATKSKSSTRAPKPVDHPENRTVDSADGDLPAVEVKVKTDDGTVTPQKDPRWDGWPRLNGFVTVVGDGEHAGKYGTADGVDHDGKVIVNTRDENTERIVVDYTDLRPAQAGRR